MNQVRSLTILRGSVSTLAVTLVLSGAAMLPAYGASTAVGYNWAGVTGADITGTGSVGHQQIASELRNQALVNAAIVGNIGAIPNVGGADSSSTVLVDSNALSATATGNAALSTAALNALDGTGIGIVHAAINHRGDATISAGVSGSALRLSATALDDAEGAFQLTDNTISAIAALNTSTISSSGSIPSEFTSTTTGRITLAFDPDAEGQLLDTQATLALSNVQANSLGVSGRSSASVLDNAVALTIEPTEVGQTLSASPALDGNSVTARYTGNQAATGVVVSVEESPAFTGSVAVANVQANAAGDVGIDPDHAHALNEGTSIVASLADPADIATGFDLQGALSVAGNTAGATATGNLTGTDTSYGTVIRLDPALSFTGATVASNTSGFADSSLDGSVTADLALLSSQSNLASSVISRTQGASVAADVDTLSGSVLVDGNAVNSTAQGNRASSLISTKDVTDAGDPIVTPTFAATAALANIQVNASGSDISALTDEVSIVADIQNVVGSSVALDANVTSSSAKGNLATSAVELTANDLTLGSVSALATGGHLNDGEVTATANASLTNLQANYTGSDITAEATDVLHAVIQSGITAVSDASLLNQNGRITASAAGNAGGNTLDLKANSLTGSAALASTQIGGSGVVSALADGGRVLIDTNEGVGDSTLAATGNRLAASASGNDVSNHVNAEGTNIVLAAASGAEAGVRVPFTTGLDSAGIVLDANDEQATASAALALSNSQLLDAGAISGTLRDSSVQITLDGSAASSSIANGTNTLSASALGNQGSSSLSIDVGSGLQTLSGSAVASLANVQGRADGNLISAVTTNSGVSTNVDGAVNASTLTASANRVETTARGNTSNGEGNNLTLTGNDVTVASIAPLTGLVTTFGPTGGVSSDLAFNLTNAQSSGVGANVSATQTGTGVNIAIEDDLAASSIALSANQFVVGAYDNVAANTVSAELNALAGSAGVQNVQLANAISTALLGSPSVPAVAPVTYGGVTGAGSVTGGDNITLDGVLTLEDEGQVTLDLAGVTDLDARAAIDSVLEGLGFSIVGDTATYANTSGTSTTIDFGAFDTFSLQSGGVITFTGLTVGGQSVIPGSPTVIASIGGDISGSTIAVAGSVAQASAVSNSVANSIDIDAGTIAAGAGLADDAAGASIDLVSGTFALLADLGLSNVQSLGPDGGANATAYGSYAIDVDLDDTSVANSALSVTGTRQQAVAGGNEATNLASIAATNLVDGVDAAATAGLLSVQTAVSGAALQATSDALIWAPAAVDASTVTLTNNRNVASSIVNRSTNGLNVAGTNIDGSSTGASADIGYPTQLVASADYFANVAQSSARDSAANASSDISNQEVSETGSAGVVGSTLDFSNNATVSEARGNLSSTAVSVGSATSANLAATSALLSSQISGGNQTATAEQSVRLGLVSASAPAVAGTTATLSGNQAAAIAASNSATNTVTVEAANIVLVSAAADLDFSHGNPGFVYTASADHVLNNGQLSSGTTAATATGSTTVDLNALVDDIALVAGTVSLDGNLTVAEARGNTAANTLSVAAGANQTSTAGILNNQLRALDGGAGAVTATATGTVTFSAGAFDDLSADRSTVGIRGNETTAVASANSAINVLNGTAGSGYGAYAGSAQGSVGTGGTVGTTDAAFGILNGQGNDATVTATATALYGGAFEGTGLTGSSLAISGNLVSAGAVGNQASNSIVLTALAGTSPTAGLTSSQVNTGSITATVSSATVGATASLLSGGIANSAIAVTGNRIEASATGNSVVNAIVAK